MSDLKPWDKISNQLLSNPLIANSSANTNIPSQIQLPNIQNSQIPLQNIQNSQSQLPSPVLKQEVEKEKENDLNKPKENEINQPLNSLNSLNNPYGGYNSSPYNSYSPYGSSFGSPFGMPMGMGSGRGGFIDNLSYSIFNLCEIAKMVENNAGSLTSFYGISKNFMKALLVNAIMLTKSTKGKISAYISAMTDKLLKTEERKAYARKFLYLMLVCMGILAIRMSR